MTRALSTAWALCTLNLRSIGQRRGSSAVLVIGNAGVVMVLVSLLAMETSISRTMRVTGHEDRAIVMLSGSTSEVSSVLQRDAVAIIIDAPGIKHDATGKPILSAELVSVAILPKKDGSHAFAPFRGVGPEGFILRPEIKVIVGRKFRAGLNEVIVGNGAHTQFRNLDVGNQFTVRGTVWSIVGIFDSGGDSHEGELIADCEVLQASLRRQGRYQAVTVMLESPAVFALFKEAVTNNPALSVDAMREKEYFAEQSRLVSGLISTLVYVISGIMAIGAIFGALNTMYSAVSARSVEIGTLRAIGFGSAVIIGSILLEALLLAFLGGLIGAVLARVFFNDYTTDTNFGSVAMELRVFSLHVTPELIVAGLACACIVGLVGGLFPAIRIARMPVANVLRSTQ